MTIQLWNKGYVTNEITDIDMYEANTCEENRVNWVTSLAAISRGKYKSKRPEARYKALMKEAALGVPSRPFEFLPVVFNVLFDVNEVKLYNPNDQQLVITFNHCDFHNNFGGPMGYIKEEKLYTNMRAAIISGIDYEKIPYNTAEQIKKGKFFAIRTKVPMFVWAQVPNTHIFLSKESQSDRYAPQLSDYWLPDDFIERVRKHCEEYKHNKAATTEQLKVKVYICVMLTMQTEKERIDFMENLSQNQVWLLFKELGYKDEISSRAMYYFKYKESIITAWGINPKTWYHLFTERNANKEIWKNGTQKQTEEFVNAIKKIYINS